MDKMTIEFRAEDPAVQAKYMELVNKVQADTDAVARLEAAETPEEIYAAVKKYLTSGFEQFKTALINTLQCTMKAVRAARKDLEADRELELDELDMVTGGGWFGNAWKWVCNHSQEVIKGVSTALMVVGAAAILVASTILTGGVSVGVMAAGIVVAAAGGIMQIPGVLLKS